MARFNKYDICHDCGQHRFAHKRVDQVGERGMRYTLWWCPDTSLPDPGRDDDPWEPSAYTDEPPVAALFDAYA